MYKEPRAKSQVERSEIPAHAGKPRTPDESREAKRVRKADRRMPGSQELPTLSGSEAKSRTGGPEDK